MTPSSHHACSSSSAQPTMTVWMCVVLSLGVETFRAASNICLYVGQNILRETRRRRRLRCMRRALLSGSSARSSTGCYYKVSQCTVLSHASIHVMCALRARAVAGSCCDAMWGLKRLSLSVRRMHRCDVNRGEQGPRRWVLTFAHIHGPSLRNMERKSRNLIPKFQGGPFAVFEASAKEPFQGSV
jgi:hypothetical protein